jgi:Protein of unknown function (DUF2569)
MAYELPPERISWVPLEDGAQEHVGVGGWLRFLVFCLVVVGALDILLRGAILVYFVMVPSHPLFPTVQFPSSFDFVGMFAVSAIDAYGIFVGVQLAKVRPGAVRTAKRFFVVAAVVPCILAVLKVLFWLLEAHGSLRAAAIGHPDNDASISNLVETTASCVIWYAYLSRSVRVRNTYRKELQDSSTPASAA